MTASLRRPHQAPLNEPSRGLLGRPRSLGGELLAAPVPLDEIGEQSAEVADVDLAEPLAQLVLHGVALCERAGADALAGRAELEMRPATIRRVAGALEVAERHHVVREPARPLLRDAEQLGEARDGWLLSGDGAQHETEGGPHRLAAGGGDRLPEAVGHAAISGGDEDREVGLAHSPHGGTKVVPSGTRVACAPDGRHARARKGWSPGTWSVKSVPAGRIRQSPGIRGCSVPSSAAIALPSRARKTSSRSMWCRGLVLPGAS